MLARDDPAACAAKDAINTALNAADQRYADYIKRGGEHLSVDTISVTAINKDIHEVACSAIAHVKSDDTALNQPFEYKLRPTLDASSFVAEVADSRQLAAAIELQMMMAASTSPNKQATVQNASVDLSDGSGSTSAENAAPLSGNPSVLSKDIQIQNPWDTIPLIHQWAQLDRTCRDSSDDNPGVQKACSTRDALGPKVNAAGYCLGTQDDLDEADMYWHRCVARSLRFGGGTASTD